MHLLITWIGLILYKNEYCYRYTGVLQCLRSIIKTNGYLGLYQGAGLYTIRTFPMYGFVFLGYEQAKLFIRTYLPFLDD